MDYTLIHEEASKLLKQCEEVKKELNKKRGSEIIGNLHYSSPDIGYSNGRRFSISAFQESTNGETFRSNTRVTTIDSQNVEWRKLVNGVNSFGCR